jgi:hypothetical protein
MKEIAVLMGGENASTNTPGWFELRTAATKNILERMTNAEKDDLRRKGEDYAKNGMPEHLQRK